MYIFGKRYSKRQKAEDGCNSYGRCFCCWCFFCWTCNDKGDSQVAPEIQKSVLSVGTIGTAFVNEYVFSPIKKLFFETKAVLKRKKLDENMDKVVVATKLRVDKMDREI